MSDFLDPMGAVQLVAAAIAGFLAGRGRIRLELERERNERKQLETQLAGAMRELAFTNALVVELVRKHGSTRPLETP